MFFNINGYIININNNKIKLKIIDNEILTKFQKNINKLYKIQNDINLNENVYNFTVNKKTKFTIQNYTYTHLSELIGVCINISGYSKYYCFELQSNSLLNEINNELQEEKKYKKGYAFICNKIYN